MRRREFIALIGGGLTTLGVAVAALAALIPGRWAARTNVVEVLHSE